MSALPNFVAVNHYNPVEELMIRIKPFWHRQTMKVRFPIHLLAGLVDK
jgi:hypothetical protein